MIKLTGGICIITAATLMGWMVSEKIKEEYRQMQYVQQLIYRLQSEIRYTRARLGEVFLKMGNSTKEPYRSWLLLMHRRMEKKNTGIFAAIWEESTQEMLAKSGLPREELHRLVKLGGQLGIADMDMQMKTLELYQEQLARAMEDMRRDMQGRIKICRCLGIISGIFIIILLI